MPDALIGDMHASLNRIAYPRVVTTGDLASSESLTEALSKAGIPSENHKFIRGITSAIGIAEYRTIVNSSKTYIRARRRDGRPDLHISWGYTNGFSEEELIRLFERLTRKGGGKS